MTKGISAVVATILIVMITVAIVGMAYAWATGIFKFTSEAAQEQVETVADKLAQIATIEGTPMCNNVTSTLYNVTFTIKNTGSKDIGAGKLGLLLDGAAVTQTSPSIGNATLAVGELKTFVAYNTTKPSKLAVSAPAGTTPDVDLTCP